MGKAILLDLDGTIYLDNTLIASVDKEIRRLHELGVKFFYITNNTSVSTNNYLRKLRDFDLPASENSIVTPTKVISKWMKGNKIEKAYIVGTKEFKRELFERCGVVNNKSNPDCVIVGFDTELSYKKLSKACSFITLGLPYYLTHVDKNCPTRNGPIPDCGAIGGLIRMTTGQVHKGHFGKPGDHYIKFLVSLLDKDDHIIVAGDREYTDAEVGMKLSAETILVCSGEFDGNTERKLDPRIAVHENLADFLRTIS